MIFLPKGFGSRFRCVPWAILLLITINVGVFIMTPKFSSQFTFELYQSMFKEAGFSKDITHPIYQEFCDKNFFNSESCKFNYSLLTKKFFVNPDPKGFDSGDYLDPSITLFLNYFMENHIKNYPNAVSGVHKKYHVFSSFNKTFQDLLISQFMHSGFLHLFGNMVVLFFLGIWVEQRLNSFLLVLYYLVGGSVGFLVADLDRGIVGASAGVSVILGLSLVFFRKMQIKTLIFSPPFLWGQVALVPMWAYVILGFVVSDVEGIVLQKSSVAHMAHLGGFFSGLVFGYLTMKNQRLLSYHLHPEDISDFTIAEGLWRQQSFSANEVLRLCEIGLSYNSENIDFKNLELELLLNLNSLKSLTLASELLNDAIRHKQLEKCAPSITVLFQKGLLDKVLSSMTPKKVQHIYQWAFMSRNFEVCKLVVENLEKTFPFHQITVKLKNSFYQSGGIHELRI